MSDTAREPIAHLWQHKETGRVYYQGPHDEAPQSTHALIGPLFLGASIPPREPTEKMLNAVSSLPEHLRKEHPDPIDPWHALMKAATLADQAASRSKWQAMYDAAIAEKEGK